MHGEKQSEDGNSDTTNKNNPALDFPVEKWLLPIIGFLLGFLATLCIYQTRELISMRSAILTFTLATFVAISIIFTIVSVLLLFASIEKDSPQVSRYLWLTIVHLCLQNVLAIVVPILLIFEKSALTEASLNWMVVVMIVGLGWTHLTIRFRTFTNAFIFTRY